MLRGEAIRLEDVPAVHDRVFDCLAQANPVLNGITKQAHELIFGSFLVLLETAEGPPTWW